MGTNSTGAQSATIKESRKNDCKGLSYIHNMDLYHFEKISKVTRSNEAWYILVKYHDDEYKFKKVKL